MDLSAELETCISFVRIERARARLNGKLCKAVDKLEGLLVSVGQGSEAGGYCLCSHVKILGCVNYKLRPRAKEMTMRQWQTPVNDRQTSDRESELRTTLKGKACLLL